MSSRYFAINLKMWAKVPSLNQEFEDDLEDELDNNVEVISEEEESEADEIMMIRVKMEFGRIKWLHEQQKLKKLSLERNILQSRLQQRTAECAQERERLQQERGRLLQERGVLQQEDYRLAEETINVARKVLKMLEEGE